MDNPRKITVTTSIEVDLVAYATEYGLELADAAADADEHVTQMVDDVARDQLARLGYGRVLTTVKG